MRTSISLDGTEGPMYPSTLRSELPGVIGAEWALHAPAAVLRDIAAACTAAADIAEMVPAPTRDGDDLADWIDPIVKGAVAP